MHLQNILPCLLRLSQLQNAPIDRLAVQEVIENLHSVSSAKGVLKSIANQLHIKPAKWLKIPDPALVPALVCSPEGEWGILRGLNAQNLWVTEWWSQDGGQWVEVAKESLEKNKLAVLNMAKSFSASSSPVYRLICDELFLHKKLLVETVIAGVIINIIALGTSFYTMQVYDRVVPTGSKQTLLVLSLGVFIAVLYELFTKRIRTRLFDRLVVSVDQRLARSVYLRFLNVRLDQLPQSVGSLASQMRSYETIRNFLTSAATRLIVDAPFAIMFVVIIASIAGYLALIPLTFVVLSIAVGLYYRRQIADLAANVNAASNFKTGLLVESVEGAETIKSGQSGWRMLARWMSTTDEARDYETKMRNVSENSQHLTASFQQLSYIAIVATGALFVSLGQITMGGLIACSILSGRVFAPIAAIPGLLVQWGHSKAALIGLDQLWGLESDHAGQEKPIILEDIQGCFRFEGVSARYGERAVLQIPELVIAPGEKVGVLGAVGAGKTTFLRLLSGMYKPQSGRILLDDVDLTQISKPVLAERVGFVQQEGRLFAGSLRENLTLGLLDPGDEAILNAARNTGLMESVITPHPRGLEQQINEGGSGVSCGQRQLIILTRAFLRKPKIWLLDEPTASLHGALEVKIKNLLMDAISPDDTLVLVTHKPKMLDAVDRVIVIANNQIVMNGPKSEVLKQLKIPVTSEEQIA